MSSFGVYIVGNNKVKDHVVALYNSLRLYNPTIDVTLIPYSSDYQTILDSCPIKLFNNLPLIKDLDRCLRDFFTWPQAPVQANKYPRLHNLLAWFGEYDQFVYMDADIVAFVDIEQFAKNLLSKGQFICYDRQYLHHGRWVFTNDWRKYYPETAIQKIFNGGFWGSHKGLISLADIERLLKEGKQRYSLFDFPNGALAQPLINYIIFETLGYQNVHNELLIDATKAEPWAGFKYDQRENALWNKAERLPFLHWAGKGIDPNNRYYPTWQHYYNLSTRPN
jgi:hypothetical protein